MIEKMVKADKEEEDIDSKNKIISSNRSKIPNEKQSIKSNNKTETNENNATEQYLITNQINNLHLINNASFSKQIQNLNKRDIHKTKKLDDSLSSHDDERILNFEESRFMIDLDSKLSEFGI
jgi:hypothetical protein